MRILITGDRHWNDEQLIRNWLSACSQFTSVTIVHGGARGADTIADKVAKELGYATACYPADWARYGRAAGPIRNAQMLDSHPDLVLAFHPDLSRSRGTKNCVEEARRRGIVTIVVKSDVSLNLLQPQYWGKA